MEEEEDVLKKQEVGKQREMSGGKGVSEEWMDECSCLKEKGRLHQEEEEEEETPSGGFVAYSLVR